MRLSALGFAGALALLGASHSPVPVGSFASGPNDAITDVAGVRVGQVTKIEGSDVRTGATGILPSADTWNDRVAAATYDLNGNGEMSGSHWVNQAGFLETPIVLTDTLDVGRADDGTISYLMQRYPHIGLDDDVPLPVVAECDDQGFNDIRGRHVTADDVATMLAGATSGDVARGDVGAGTGMHAFGFKGGIGSASRVLPAPLGGYTVGVLVNVNTGSRDELVIGGVHVGRLLDRELLPVFPHASLAPATGRAADGSIIIVIATDAPLDHNALTDLTKRAVLGLGRTGATSHVSSGDLLLAFSTTHRYPRAGGIAGPALETDEQRVDALYTATADATEAAIDDALFSAKTLTGAHGATLYGLPYERVKPLLLHAR
ncbi:MAG: P1 family peptidase [Candidatus Velthaea sp.]